MPFLEKFDEFNRRVSGWFEGVGLGGLLGLLPLGCSKDGKPSSSAPSAASPSGVARSTSGGPSASAGATATPSASSSLAVPPLTVADVLDFSRGLVASEPCLAAVGPRVELANFEELAEQFRLSGPRAAE